MAEPERRKRDYDDRAHRVRRLINDLIAVGVVPRVVELDGLHVEVAEYRPPGGDPTVQSKSTQSSGVLSVAEESARAQRASVRSHRVQAREELGRRLREAGR